jgi:hypothetical protein
MKNIKVKEEDSFEKFTSDCLIIPVIIFTNKQSNGFFHQTKIFNEYKFKKITKYFGEEMKSTIQETISKEFYGYQPIGTCFIEKSNKNNIKHICHLPICDIDSPNYKNIYLSMISLFKEISRFNAKSSVKINNICFDGLLYDGEEENQVKEISSAYFEFFNQKKIVINELFIGQRVLDFVQNDNQKNENIENNESLKINENIEIVKKDEGKKKINEIDSIFSKRKLIEKNEKKKKQKTDKTEIEGADDLKGSNDTSKDNKSKSGIKIYSLDDLNIGKGGNTKGKLFTL